MSTRKKRKITTRVITDFARNADIDQSVFDAEISGFHARRTRTGIRFRLKYLSPLDGRQRVFIIGKYPDVTPDQARTIAKQLAGRISAGEDPQLEKKARIEEERKRATLTIGAYLKQVYTTHQSRKKSGQDTVRMIESHFKDWMARPMDSITESDIHSWQTRKEAEGLSYQRVKRIYDGLKAMLNHAKRRKVIKSHHLEGVQLEKPAMTEDDLIEAGTARRYLTEEEVQALFIGLDRYQEWRREQRRRSRKHGKSHLPDLDAVEFVDHVKPLVLLLFYSGFRPGDAFGLRWEHVNLTFGSITKTIEKTAHHVPEPRTFPLSGPIIKILKTWHIQLGEPATGYVFPSQRTGSRMDKNAMQKPWKRIKEFGGLPEDLNLYALRHNFASQLILAGADLLTVSKLMAHTDIETTIKNYAHLRPDLAKQYVEEFAELWATRKPQNKSSRKTGSD